jgi:predicted DNA-binding protein (MmcQ/YjbR family)
MFSIEELRDYCIAKKGVIEDFPFDEETIVFKVGGKMFALANIDDFDGINLKCDPAKAVELREQYEAIQPGYHMNKKHWNTLEMDGSLPVKLIKELIDHSYDLVVASLPKKDQLKLKSK